ncbi:hypothetical protein VTO73DRAFT_15290 [Trametes versicolor]
MGFKDPQGSVLKNMGPLIDAVCCACEKKGIDYIWIDRICIMENKDADRDWHLVNMANIYRCAGLCLPCFPSIKSPAAWSERELEAASDHGPELWPLVDIWLGKAEHAPLFEPDEKFSIKRARMRREPTEPAVVALTARAVQKTRGDSKPEFEAQHVSKWPWKLCARTSGARRSKPTEVWYLYAGKRRIQEEVMNEHRDLDGSSKEPYYALILVVTQHVDSTDAKRRYYAHTGGRMMSVGDANEAFADAKEKDFELVVESY